MKAIKILTFVIIGILIVGAGVGAYVYFAQILLNQLKKYFIIIWERIKQSSYWKVTEQSNY